jgi:integrase
VTGRRRVSGEGTLYRRKDGRYEAAAYLPTLTGNRRRVRVYAASREEARAKLTALEAHALSGAGVPDQSWRLGEYLDYYLENIVRTNRRPATYNLYEQVIRLYLKPSLGSAALSRLTVRGTQDFCNRLLAQGHSVRKVQLVRTVLSAALTRAVREELISRNVARLVELPAWQRRDIHPWSPEEARRFLNAASSTSLYPAYLLLLVYGLRRGEVLGLRWQDVDLARSELHIRQQLGRVGREILEGPVKTSAGRRDLPLLTIVSEALGHHQAAAQDLRVSAAASWHGRDDDSALVFTTATGRPIEPSNFVRSFQATCGRAGVRIIAVHHLRHTTATLLKDLGVPVRDAQLILGHSRISITQEIYQHDTMDSRREALQRVEKLFLRTVGCTRSRQISRQTGNFVDAITSSISGGVWRIRTAHLLRAMNENDSSTARALSVRSLVTARMRHWLVGVVAVKLSRQIILRIDDSGEAPCSAE